MEHHCEQCRTLVEDGRPFCPQCRAPQVRVERASPLEDSAELNRDPEPALARMPETGRSFSPGLMDTKAARSAALKAGIAGVLMGMIPLLGNILTGALAVFFYRRSTRFSLNAGSGSRLGGAAGAVAFAISALFTVVQVFVFHAQKESEEAMFKFMAAVGVDPTNPEIQASIHGLFTPSGMAIAVVFGMIVAVGLAAIGGALASAAFRPRSGS